MSKASSLVQDYSRVKIIYDYRENIKITERLQNEPTTKANHPVSDCDIMIDGEIKI